MARKCQPVIIREVSNQPNYVLLVITRHNKFQDVISSLFYDLLGPSEVFMVSLLLSPSTNISTPS